MKKKLFVLLTVLCVGLISVYADDKNTQTSSKPIQIKILKDSMGHDRTIGAYVSADFNTENIEIEMYNTGEGYVYIVDCDNEIVDYAPVMYGVTCMTLPSPGAAGTYTLVIACENFYGEGIFMIGR